tara:strand:+ start:160 stop:336 length:177 start_codon:yes stop_codon:yes gene_type:complete
MSSVYERRVLVPAENRLVFVFADSSSAGRIVYVSAEDRTVYVASTTTSAERTVYVTED